MLPDIRGSNIFSVDNTDCLNYENKPLECKVTAQTQMYTAPTQTHADSDSMGQRWNE